MGHPENMTAEEAQRVLARSGPQVEAGVRRGASRALARGSVLQAGAVAKAERLGTRRPFPYEPSGLVFYEGFARTPDGRMEVEPAPGRKIALGLPVVAGHTERAVAILKDATTGKWRMVALLDPAPDPG